MVISYDPAAATTPKTYSHLYIILELGAPVSRILLAYSKVAARFSKNKAITAEVMPPACQ